MPELPEARTIASRLHAAVAGCEIVAMRLCRRDMLKTGSPAELAVLAGAKLDRVDTRGKYVVLHAGIARLVVQLGMSGQLRLGLHADPQLPHTHLVISFADGRDLRYVNPRRIAGGLLLLGADGGDCGPLAHLGPEATAIGRAEFIASVGSHRRAIKTVLLDPRVLAGVGNIYSDESLARAGIRPTRRAERLSRADLARLHRAVREVLRQAIAAGGSSLRDANPFVDADGNVGHFAARHRVYGRAGLPCLTCGATLKRVLLGGRTSTFCPRCQT
jgi:formamidopyrimidine-DNA glycosylase